MGDDADVALPLLSSIKASSSLAVRIESIQALSSLLVADASNQSPIKRIIRVVIQVYLRAFKQGGEKQLRVQLKLFLQCMLREKGGAIVDLMIDTLQQVPFEKESNWTLVSILELIFTCFAYVARDGEAGLTSTGVALVVLQGSVLEHICGLTDSHEV